VSTGDDGRRRHMDRMEVRVKKVGEDWVWAARVKMGWCQVSGRAGRRTHGRRQNDIPNFLVTSFFLGVEIEMM
jgi:hypothetical protein